MTWATQISPHTEPRDGPRPVWIGWGRRAHGSPISMSQPLPVRRQEPRCLTGRYPLKAGVREVISPRTLRGLPEAEETAAEIFLEAGYRTGMVGKWHLGANPVFLPTNHGFESWFGLPYSNDYSPRSINNPSIVCRDVAGIAALPGYNYR